MIVNFYFHFQQRLKVLFFNHEKNALHLIISTVIQSFCWFSMFTTADIPSRGILNEPLLIDLFILFELMDRILLCRWIFSDDDVIYVAMFRMIRLRTFYTRFVGKVQFSICHFWALFSTCINLCDNQKITNSSTWILVARMTSFIKGQRNQNRLLKDREPS